MKKIVLIDDNSHGQRAYYGASFVDEDVYADCLQHIEKVNGETDFSFIKDAACIMVHKTLEDYIGGQYISDSHKGKERIEDELVETNIPIVWFSDGDPIDYEWQEEPLIVVSGIKKSEFYPRLRPFLDEYRKSGEVNLRIIAYGDNYYIRFMREWYMKIMHKLLGYAKKEIINEDMIDRPSLHLFIKNADLEGNITFERVMDEIDGVYTVKALTEKLNNIITGIILYGKNISSWE